jgi:hypothetical protein
MSIQIVHQACGIVVLQNREASICGKFRKKAMGGPPFRHTVYNCKASILRITLRFSKGGG